jgi:hypothetical protein
MIRDRRILLTITKRRLLTFSLFLSWPVFSLAGTITVDDDGPADYASIKEAIEAASEGDTVFVKAGFYHESHLHLKEGMVLQGEGADNTFIGGEFPEQPSGPPLIFIDSIQHAKVDGFALWSRGTRDGGYGLIRVVASTPTITRNRLTGALFAIIISGYDPDIGLGSINGNTIADNGVGIEVKSKYPENRSFLDLRWNWWGTTDENSIKEKLIIHDTLPGMPQHGQYNPWLTEPVTVFDEIPGLHYNNIFGNVHNVSTMALMPAVDGMGWGEIKAQMRR